MSDLTFTPISMPANEAAGRALVARMEFKNESVWLPMLAVQHWNAGQMFMEGKTFTECLIEGPGVMAVMDGTQFDSCNMGVATNPRTLLYKPLGDRLAGVIGMSNCRFVRCRFVQVGFTGTEEMLEQMETMLLSARARIADAGAPAS